MTKVRSYSELRLIDTFEGRYDYLKIGGGVGEATFGFDRYINQAFYRSSQWRQIRNHVISRDNGCDLGIAGYEINGSVLVHHLNPMSSNDIVHNEAWILEPDFLITTTHNTHNAIHYGNTSLLPHRHVERQPGDTKLW